MYPGIAALTRDCESAWTTAHPQASWMDSSLLGEREMARKGEHRMVLVPGPGRRQ